MSNAGVRMSSGERVLDDRVDEVTEALRGTNGILAAAAVRLGVHRDTLANWLRDRPGMRDVTAAIRESNIDYVESKLFKMIREDDVRAVTFFLQTQAKHRGYATRVEQTGADGGPIQHEVAQPTPDDMMTLLAKLAGERGGKVINGNGAALPNGHATNGSGNGADHED